MLRTFQIDSDDLDYVGGKAPVTFSKKPNVRCAITAITAKGVQLFAHQNLLPSLKINGREHIQGEAFPLALISNQGMPTEDATGGTAAAKLAAFGYTDETTGVAADAINDAMSLNNFKASVLAIFDDVKNQLATLAACGCTSHAPQHFPGHGLIMPDGQQVGGIPVEARDIITMGDLEDLTNGSAELENVTLHCVELPEDCKQGRSTDAMWEGLKRGVGVVHFVGVKKAGYSAAMQETLNYKPQTHGAAAARQLEIRGSLTDDTANLPKETDFQKVSVEISTATESTPTNDVVLARSVIGTAAQPVPMAATVDLMRDETASIKVASAAPTVASTLRLCVITEGRDTDGAKIKLASAPN